MRPITLATVGVLTVLSLSLCLQAMAANEFYITINGQKQGQFKGEGRQNQIVGVGFQYEVTSPRDAATGQATGRRMHKPVVITKEWDAASPQLFQALVTNENLPHVDLQFVRTAPDGREEAFYTIKLTNATITSIRQYTGVLPGATNAADIHQLEEVSFTFQKIEVESTIGKTMATDDWLQQ